MANKTPADAAADLQLLNRSQAIVDYDQVLDFGPAWYAPVLATMIGAATTGFQALDGWSGLVFNGVALGAGAFVAIHDYQRRRVRTRPNRRTFLPVMAIVLLVFAVARAWETAASVIGIEDFMPWRAAIAWVLTALFFLALRSILMKLRRRMPLS